MEEERTIKNDRKERIENAVRGKNDPLKHD